LPSRRGVAIASEANGAAADDFDFAWLEVSTKGSMRQQRRDGYPPRNL
jgi:hypothetical protein